MQLPDSAHLDLPWRIHAITPTSGSRTCGRCPRPAARTTSRARGAVRGRDPAQRASRVVGALFALRWKLGELLGWDDEATDVGARVPSLRDRLPQDLRDGRPARTRSLPFRPLYLLDDEFAAEIANRRCTACCTSAGSRTGPAPPRPDGRARQAQRAARRGLHGRHQAVPAPDRVPADAARDRAPVAGARLTQADRRARSRAALLEAAARGDLARRLRRAQARRGRRRRRATRAARSTTSSADKDALVLATVEWVSETWWEEVGTAVRRGPPAARGARSSSPAATRSTAAATSRA